MPPAPVPRLAAAVLAVLLALPSGPADADVLVPRRGKKVEGTIVRHDDSEVVLNIYFSPNPGVTNSEHLVRLPADEVKSVEIVTHPEVAFHQRLAALAPGDADGLVALAAFADEHKLGDEADMAYALALAVDETRKDALKGLGGASKWKSLAPGRLELNPAAREKLAAYLAEADPAQRAALHAELTATGFERRPEELERLRRSTLEPLGLTEDRPVAWNAPAHPDAVATWYVPRNYTPLRPWPLILGLHGGGPGGKAGDEVVGSGPSAMNFYRELAETRGFVVVCPTALSAGWGSPDNEQLVRDVREEALHRLAIDPDRVHLTGHSMGGFGTWALGPRLAEDLAAISPMAGAGSGVPTLVKTRTPIFIYHSADDFIDVSSARTAARQLKDSDLDFIYTELPNEGHGFPESIRKELFDFFAPRRRHDRKRKTAWPRCSLDGKVTPDERRFLGDPLDALSSTPPDLDDLIDRLELGGGCAREAAQRIVALRPAGAAEALAKVLKAAKVNAPARAEAARALGALGEVGPASAALKRALGAEADRGESVVVVAAARAAAALGDADALGPIEAALQRWSAFHLGKLSGGALDFADWERSLGVLVPLVEAWATLAPPGHATSALGRHVVEAVLAPAHKVNVSDRVPQDPSLLRTALAKALRAAYTKAGAADEAWTALEASLAHDAQAQAAARR